MITNISTGNYDIIESNMVYLYKNDMDLVITFEFENFKFIIKLYFINNEKISEQRLNHTVNGNIIEFTCTNFNNVLGTGTISPLEIATIENKKLYIHFWSFIQGNMEAGRFIRKVEYTVFLER